MAEPLTYENLPPGMNRSYLPFPRPDQALWDSVMAAGFDAYPERLANLQRSKASEGRAETLDHLPTRLDIENVSRCNFHCTMCQVSDWDGYKRGRDMTVEEYRTLIDSLVNALTEIKLQGMGEPLLGKCYFDMIRYARERHIWVRSITNGSILGGNDNYKKVIDADVCELHVSIDGCDAATFEKIRRGGKFDIVSRNCRLLNEYAKAAGRERTRMWSVIQRDNYHQIEQFPIIAADLGFTRLTLSLDLNDWGQSNWRAVNDQIDMHRRMSPELAARLIESGRSRGVEVTFWYMDEKYEFGPKEKLCPWPFGRGYISSEMKLVPCCMVANPDVSDLGDATKIVDTWNGPRMREFRRMHLEGSVPEFCWTCYKA
jgi:pyrroloquinoline quinone biosynthesis protein E